MHRVALAVATAAWAAAAAHSSLDDRLVLPTDYQQKLAAVFDRKDDSESGSGGDDDEEGSSGSGLWYKLDSKKLKGVCWKHSKDPTKHVKHFCPHDEGPDEAGSSDSDSGSGSFHKCDCHVKDHCATDPKLSAVEKCEVAIEKAKVLMAVTIQCCHDRSTKADRQAAEAGYQKHLAKAEKKQDKAIKAAKKAADAGEDADPLLQAAKKTYKKLHHSKKKDDSKDEDSLEKEEETKADAIDAKYKGLIKGIKTQVGTCDHPPLGQCHCGVGKHGLKKSVDCFKKGQKKESKALAKTYEAKTKAALHANKDALKAAKAAYEAAKHPYEDAEKTAIAAAKAAYAEDKKHAQKKRDKESGECKDKAHAAYIADVGAQGACAAAGASTAAMLREDEAVEVGTSARWPSAVAAAAVGAVAVAWLTKRRRSSLPEEQPLLAEQSTV